MEALQFNHIYSRMYSLKKKNTDQALMCGRPEDISWSPDNFFFPVASILAVSQVLGETAGLTLWREGVIMLR